MKYGLSWLRSNDRILLKSTIIGILLLTMIHVYLSLSLLDPYSGFFDFLQITTILILVVMFISILLKGLVPVAISCLGLVLLYGSIAIPSAIENSLGPFYYKASTGYLSLEAINRGTHGFFLLRGCYGCSRNDSSIQTTYSVYTKQAYLVRASFGQSIQIGMKIYN